MTVSSCIKPNSLYLAGFLLIYFYFTAWFSLQGSPLLLLTLAWRSADLPFCFIIVPTLNFVTFLQAQFPV
jgi:hypothetical protein